MILDVLATIEAVLLTDPTPAQVFGGQDVAKHVHRRLLLDLHPDTLAGQPPAVLGRAHAALVRVNELWDAAEDEMARGCYGTTCAPDPSPLTISSKRHTYADVAPLVAGDVADFYSCTWDGGTERGVLKVVRDQRDASVLANEAATLKRLHSTADAKAHPFIPDVVDSFAFSTPGKPRRRATVLPLLHGFYTLEEVRAEYGDGIDPRDAAWIGRRILFVLDHAHEAGVVHGAVLPCHVMIHPAEHGLVLVGWGASVPVGQALTMRVRRFRDLYPAEVAAKMPATQATDLAMFARCLKYLLGDNAPGPFTAFVQGCTLPSPRHRPHDALALLREFDDLLERMWGRRTFHAFEMKSPSRA